MPKRSSSRRSPDPNVVAFRAVQHVLSMGGEDTAPGKNPAAVMLGRLGGLKGGKARADALSPKKRKEIARKAANARWNK